MEISFNILFLFVFHILMAVSVARDCNARSIVKKDLYVALTFFFPIITGIVYACKRNKAKKFDEKPENAKKLVHKSKRAFVFALVVFLISGISGTVSMNNANPMFVSTYSIVSYDRNCEPYFFNQKVMYYDVDGNTYQKSDDNSSFVNTETGEEYHCTHCFVDKDGYFVYFDNEAMCELSGDGDIYFDPSTGHSYLWAPHASWDRTGVLYDLNGNHLVLS